MDYTCLPSDAWKYKIRYYSGTLLLDSYWVQTVKLLFTKFSTLWMDVPKRCALQSGETNVSDITSHMAQNGSQISEQMGRIAKLALQCLAARRLKTGSLHTKWSRRAACPLHVSMKKNSRWLVRSVGYMLCNISLKICSVPLLQGSEVVRCAETVFILTVPLGTSSTSTKFKLENDIMEKTCICTI